MNFPFGNANAACQVLWGNFFGDTVGVFFSTFTWNFEAVFGKLFYHVTSWHAHFCFTSIFVEAIFAPHRICFRVVIWSNPGIPRWKIHSCRWVSGKSLRCSIIKSYGTIPGKLTLDVSNNSGTPKSSIFYRVFHYNHPIWCTTISGNTHIISRKMPGPKRYISKSSHPWQVSYRNGWENDATANAWYCLWKKSCTTWHRENPVNNGRLTISNGAELLPSTDSESQDDPYPNLFSDSHLPPSSFHHLWCDDFSTSSSRTAKRKRTLVNPVNRSTSKFFCTSLTGWWFQPLWKILVKMGIFPR